MTSRRLLLVFLTVLLAFPVSSFAQEEDEFTLDEVDEPKDSKQRRRQRRKQRRKERKLQRQKRRAKRNKKMAPQPVVKARPAPTKSHSSRARLKLLKEKYAAHRWPTVVNERPLVLAKSLLEVRGDTVLISLASGSEGDPVGLMPRVYFGVTNIITVGLVHGDLAALGARTGAGGLGFCISDTNNCPRAKAYNDVGIDALYDFGSFGDAGDFELAAHGGLVAGSLSPFALALNVGALGRWRKDKLAIVVDPRLRLGLTARSLDIAMSMATIPFNREVLSIPVSAHYQLSEKFNAFATTGFSAMLSNVGETFVFPLGVGATYSITANIDVGGELTFWLASGGFDAGEFRYFILRFAYRTPLG